MYDAFDRYDDYAYGDPAHHADHHGDDERLRHLVFLDGLLVDTFTEPVRGTPYACLALAADAARRDAALPPPTPEHDRVLAWLDAVVGGRRALLDLDAAPLEDAPPEAAADPPADHAVDHAVDQRADHPAYDAAVDLLERVARDVFHDDEVGVAAHHVLDRVWAEDPELLTSRRTVPQVAGGVLWVVGRANGLFGQAPAVRQKDVQRALWLSQPLSGQGRTVERCVRPLGGDAPPRPWRLPSLEPLGDRRLLTSRTRRDLVTWRDRALEAQRRHREDQEAKGVLPREVEW